MTDKVRPVATDVYSRPTDFSFWAGDSLRRRDLAFHRGSIDESPRLTPPQRRVVAAGAQQLVVCPLLNDVATVEDDEPVHGGNGRKPVRDGDHGLARHQGVEARLDRTFDLAVRSAPLAHATRL